MKLKYLLGIAVLVIVALGYLDKVRLRSVPVERGGTMETAQ